MNNLEAEGTSRKFPEPGQLLLFSCARTAPRRHRVVQEPERAAAARPTPVRGRRGSPRPCLAAGRRWGRRHRAAQRVSPKRSCLQNEASSVPLASPSCSDHISSSTQHHFCPAQRLTKVKTDLKSARRDAFGNADGAEGRGNVEEWSSIASWAIGGERRTARATARSGERIAWWML